METRLETIANLDYGTVYSSDIGETIYFKKNLSKSRHFLRKLKAWGFQASEVTDMNALNVDTVVLQVDGKYISTSLKCLITNGQVANFGHGNQVFLQGKFFDSVKEGKYF